MLTHAQSCRARFDLTAPCTCDLATRQRAHDTYAENALIAQQAAEIVKLKKCLRIAKRVLEKYKAALKKDDQ